MVMIDIDNFKSINDTFGHLFGDQALQLLGSIIGRSFRPPARAYRIGGDEFILLVPRKEIKQTCGYIQSNLKKDGCFTVSQSVVLALSGVITNQDLHHAEVALQHAKLTGKNRITIAWDISPPALGNLSSPQREESSNPPSHEQNPAFHPPQQPNLSFKYHTHEVSNGN